MSELKVYKFLGIDEVYPDANLGSEYYLKSEVDKVIAEKDKEIRHHKHKRCMEMAKWCYSMDCKMLDKAAENGTYFKDSWFWKRASWYGKWKRKWLELAEKFEEESDVPVLRQTKQDDSDTSTRRVCIRRCGPPVVTLL